MKSIAITIKIIGIQAPHHSLDMVSVKAQNAIDLTATITTPENIQFEYRIAGPFRRLPALLLDFSIRLLFWMTMVVLFFFIGITIPLSGPLLIFTFFVFWFALEWFYGLFFELQWGGQTPGKWLTKIRVIAVDGRPINAYQATVRNFLRLADFAPMVSVEMFVADAPPAYIYPTFLVSLICMTLTARFQRLGDLAAGTMVVVNERAWVPNKVKLDDPRIASLSEHIPPNFRMSSTLAKAIALYAERRGGIAIARRMELAMHLARPLFKKFNFREDTSPDLLLCALYYREFVSKDAFSDTNRYAPPPAKETIVIASTADSQNESIVEAKLAPPGSLPPLLKGTQ